MMKKRHITILSSIIIILAVIIACICVLNRKTDDYPQYPENQNDSPLQGKTIIFLGSSITYGEAAGGRSFVDIMEEKDGINAIKEAVSGTTLADTGDESYIQRMENSIDKSVQADAFVCQLSTNDALQRIPLGVVADT